MAMIRYDNTILIVMFVGYHDHCFSVYQLVIIYNHLWGNQVGDKATSKRITFQPSLNGISLHGQSSRVRRDTNSKTPCLSLSPSESQKKHHV